VSRCLNCGHDNPHTKSWFVYYTCCDERMLVREGYDLTASCNCDCYWTKADEEKIKYAEARGALMEYLGI